MARQKEYVTRLNAKGLDVRLVVTPNIGPWYPDDLERLLDESLTHIERGAGAVAGRAMATGRSTSSSASQRPCRSQRLRPRCPRSYSCLSATSGSTRVARRAGSQHDTSAAPPSNATADT